MPHPGHPPMAAGVTLVARAAGDQPAHRMADQRDLGDLDWPVRHHGLQQLGHARPVVGHVEARVAAHVQRRVGPEDQPAGPRRVGLPVVGLTEQAPGEVALAQPVDETTTFGVVSGSSSASSVTDTSRPRWRRVISSSSARSSLSRSLPRTPFSAARAKAPRGESPRAGAPGRLRRAADARHPRARPHHPWRARRRRWPRRWSHGSRARGARRGPRCRRTGRRSRSEIPPRGWSCRRPAGPPAPRAIVPAPRTRALHQTMVHERRRMVAVTAKRERPHDRRAAPSAPA